jgi:hypothetical protein
MNTASRIGSTYKTLNLPDTFRNVGWDSSVGIATDYGLDGPGTESRWSRDFPHLSRPSLGPCAMGTGSFPGVECGRGVVLTPNFLLVPRSKKPSSAIPLLSLRALVACKMWRNLPTLRKFCAKPLFLKLKKHIKTGG